MSANYRVDVCPNNRAGCSATHCKNDGVKIKKGELRQGVVVAFQEHQSMKYRHWGCVTPAVLHNWQAQCEGDMELVDGYDVLPEEVQEKVKRALEQGHVDDEDWNGDPEMNRWNGSARQGMFKKTPKKKATDEDEDVEDDEASPTKKPAPRKRGRAKQDDGDEDADKPAVKPAVKKGRGKKAVKPEDDEGDDEPAEAPPAKKARKSKKATDEEVETAPKKARGRKPKATNDDDEAVKEEGLAAAKKPRAKRGAKKAADAAADADADEADADLEHVKPKPQKRKVKKAAVSEDE